MKVTLTCVDAAASTGAASFSSLPITIGRGDEADLTLRDSWASRVHCRLTNCLGRLVVEDLQSSNGTRLNGQLVTRAEVRSGDRVTVGITTFRVIFSRLPVPAGTEAVAGVSEVLRAAGPGLSELSVPVAGTLEPAGHLAGA